MPLVPALASALLALPSARDSAYRLPPPEIVRILDAEPTPSVEFSPDARWMLFVERPAMPSIADVVRPWVGLAGLRIDPVHGAPPAAIHPIHHGPSPPRCCDPRRGPPGPSS